MHELTRVCVRPIRRVRTNHLKWPGWKSRKVATPYEVANGRLGKKGLRIGKKPFNATLVFYPSFL